jgi:hypothetical protein
MSRGNHPGLEGPFLRMQFSDRPGIIVLPNRTSTLYLEKDEDLLTFDTVLVELLTVALDDEESVALVARLAATLE